MKYLAHEQNGRSNKNQHSQRSDNDSSTRIWANLIWALQQPHCGMRPQVLAWLRTPRPRFGADVAPNFRPLPPPPGAAAVGGATGASDGGATAIGPAQPAVGRLGGALRTALGYCGLVADAVEAVEAAPTL